MTMNTIELRDVCPAVFAGMMLHSEVWRATVRYERGKRYCIEASSGAGKSSLCAFLYGYRNDYSGTITIDGDDLRAVTVNRRCELRQRHLAYVPQDLCLFGTLTAIENCEIKNNLAGRYTSDEIVRLLTLVGLGDRLDRPVERLSIGQQQRVAIVRALCQPFDFLILDEPVSHLDAQSNTAVATLIDEVAREQDAAVICTSVGNALNITFDYRLKL